MQDSHRSTRIVLVTAVVFLGLAAAFMADISCYPKLLPEVPLDDKEFVSLATNQTSNAYLAVLSAVKDSNHELTDAEGEDLLIAVAPPPFSEDIFPCSDCHDAADEVNTTRREVDMHDDIVFDHDSKNRWCLDCHDTRNRDVLHLADGRPVKFTESYLLCGQCHGPQLKNWRAGDHGRRTGYWSGRKEYLLCAHCHDPQSPTIKPLEPLPPPPRQETIR